MKDFGVRLSRLLLLGIFLALVGLGAGETTAGAGQMMLVAGSVNGLPGTQILVPVQATGFVNVNSIQFSFHWSASDATFVGVEQFGLLGLASGNFGTTMANSGTLTVSWDDPDGTSLNVPDGTTMFMVRLQVIGTVGSTSSLFINGSPTPIEVADGDLQVMSAGTTAGQLFVGAPNAAPVLAAIGNKTINEGSALTFTVTATDSDLPAQTLTYSLDAGAPAGASLNSTTGVFTWTPTEAQGPGTYQASIRVTDSGLPAKSTAQTITITVNEVNVAPVLAAIANKTVSEGSLLTFTVAATDADLPAQTLTYSLDAGAPAGASINPATGVFTWTPTESQGGVVNSVTIRVTDNGSPVLTAFQTITITVLEVNTTPVLAAIGSKTVNEGSLLTFTASATDADLPVQALTFTLEAGAPAGASINPVTGVFNWTPTEAQGPSNYPVTIRVTDNGSPVASASETITITVNEVNTAPVLAAIANRTISEGTLLTFTATATDADLPPQTLTYSLDAGAPAGASIDPATGVFTWTPTEAQGPSTNPVTIRVTDNASPPLSAARTITITVNDLNSAPVLVAIGNKTVLESTPLTFTAAATDTDLPAQTLTFSLDAGAPAGANINPVTGVFNWTPTKAQGPATYPVTIRVTDSGTPSMSGAEAITITVDEINTAPVLAVIGSKTVNEGTLLAFTASATDADLPVQTLTYTLDAGAPAGASINAFSGLFTWTPTKAQGPNSYPVTIRVTDNGSPAASAAEAITITVNEVNTAPVLAALANKTINEGALLAFTATATDADLPAQTLTYSLDAGAPAGASIDPATGVFTWTPTEAQGPSTNSVTIRVTDSSTSPLSAFRTITITVNEVNSAPVLAAIGNKTVIGGSLLSFTASATDADLPAQTLTYSLDAGAPAGASINPSSGVFSWTPAKSLAAGTYPVSIRVTDSGTPNLGATQSVSIALSQVNTAPTLTPIGSRTVSESTLLTFTVSASDADLPAQTLAYSLDAGAPAGASINSASGVFTWTPTEAQGPGSFPITIRVTDNGSPISSASETITVTVNEVNVAPVLAAIANKTVSEGSLLSFTVSATDADLPAQTLTYSLTGGAPAGASIDPVTGVFTWTPTEVQGPSTNTVTIRVTDNGTPALSASRAVSITVNEVNLAPVLAAIGNKTVNEGSLLSFTASASDADLPAQTLTYSLAAGAPAGASINPATGVFNWTPTEAQGPSANVVTIRVTDSGTPALSASETITITVNEVNTAPALATIGNKTGRQGNLLTFQATATDADLPAQTLAFSLDAGAPAGASIDAATGVFAWAPTVAQAPSTNQITIRVADNGTPAMSAFQTITVTVTVQDVNTSPVLAPIGNKTATQASPLTFTVSATDADLPAQTLTCSLDAGAPAGASIDPATGVFTWTPTQAQSPSTNLVTVRVTDSGSPAASASQTLTITVSQPNTAPVLAGIGNKSVNEGSLLTFTASATDSDQPPQTRSFTLDAGAPAGASIDPASGVFTWTPTEAQGPGAYPVTIRVTDSGSPAASASETITITVREVNVAPVLTAIGNKTIAERTPLSFTVSATDADLPAQTLTYTLDAGAPGGASIDPATGLFAWTPTEAQGPGAYPVTIRVTDNGSPALSAAEAMTITVLEVNSAPVLSPIGNKTVTANTLLTFTATAADSDLPAQTLRYSLAAGAPTGASIDPATGVFTWTPTAAQGPSNYPVTVGVTDSGSPAMTCAETISITVNAGTGTPVPNNANQVNTAPVLAAVGNKTISEGSLLTFTVSATDADVPAQTLAFSLGVGAPEGASINPATGVFTWTPTEAQGPSTITVTIRVADNGSPALSAFQNFTITVNEVNNAPVLAHIGDQTVTEGSLLSFTVSATDTDVPSQTLAYSLAAGAPVGAAINPANGLFTWTPTEAQGPSNYPVTIRVTDNGTPVASAAETITITVNEVNSPPVLAPIGNKTVNEGILLTFKASATDADRPAQSLTYSLDAGGPVGASINSTNGVFTWTPTEAQGPSNYPVTIRVTDNGSPSANASETIHIAVNEVNVAPVLAPIGNRTISEGTLLTLTVSATDADLPAQTLTYSLGPGAPAGASIDPATGVFTWTPTEVQAPSTTTITFRVTDNGSPALSASQTITITAGEVNTAPVLAAIGDKNIDEGSLLTFKASATDADLPAQTLTFSLDAGVPLGATINPITGVFTWTPTEAQGPSNYPVTIRVTDNGSPARNASETITVSVNEVNTAPVLAAIGNKTVNEGTLLTFKAPGTDADLPAQTLTYSLDAGAPAGARIDPTTGVFTWTPTEIQGPTAVTVTIRVKDNGFPSLSVFQNVTITVYEVNAAPILMSIGNKTVNEGSLLTFKALATDADAPAQTLTFSLAVGAPLGATISPTTGVFTWTPTEAQGPSTNLVTVRVTDNGIPAASASETITIVVREVNTTPVLIPIGNKTANESALLTFKVSATDADIPAQTLTYSLAAGAPAGASINPTTGVFTWTPTEAQGPNTYPITVWVRDNGSPAASTSETITITVNELNLSPLLTAITNQIVNEGSLLTFAASATDTDIPAQTLTYSLATGAPAGASIDPVTGIFAWTPTEAQGPAVFSVTIRVTDNGTPALSASRTFTVTVKEVNTAPVLAPIGDKSINEGALLTFKASAADADLPAQVLTYGLGAGAPVGASINPVTGVFTWTPTEAQGPSNYPVTIRVVDNGSPSGSAAETITISVSEVNTAPVLAAIAAKTVSEGSLLTFKVSAADADLPAQTLTYSLGAGAPAGASIDPASGVFTWIPTEIQGPSTITVTIRVTDNGSPALSAFQNVALTVYEVNTAPVLAAIGDKRVAKGSLLTFAVSATDADTPAQALSYSLLAGAPVGASINPSSGVFTWTPTAAQGPSTNALAVRVADSGVPSLSATQRFTVTVLQSNDVPTTTTSPNSGRVVTVGEQPLLEVLPSTNHQPVLILYALPGTTCVIESTSDEAEPRRWQTAWQGTLTNLSQVIQPAGGDTNRLTLFRARTTTQ